MIQEQTENLNRSVISKEIELLIKHFPRKKNSGPDGFPVNSNTHLNISHLQTHPKNRRWGNIPNSYYEASVTLRAQPDKETPRKDCRPKFLMNIDAKKLNNLAAY